MVSAFCISALKPRLGPRGSTKLSHLLIYSDNDFSLLNLLHALEKEVWDEIIAFVLQEKTMSDGSAASSMFFLRILLKVSYESVNLRLKYICFFLFH